MESCLQKIYMDDLQQLIGYQFEEKNLLIEAMTHPSCERDHTIWSYQRLEFLRDAVLDMIVASELFETAQKYTPRDMTLAKAALVNASFLAFLCLEHSIEKTVSDITGNKVKPVLRNHPN